MTAIQTTAPKRRREYGSVTSKKKTFWLTTMMLPGAIWLLLIRYLREKYPTVRYMWGHYQQKSAEKSGLYKESISGYYHAKVDPGPKFMKALQKNLKDTGLLFFKP